MHKEKGPSKEGPLKYDEGKLRLDLIPIEFLEATARGLTFGARKYGDGNWAIQPGFKYSRLYGALLRHVTAWAKGEDNDPESGNNHLDHAACMLAFLISHSRRGLGTDDRVAIGLASRPDVKVWYDPVDHQ